MAEHRYRFTLILGDELNVALAATTEPITVEIVSSAELHQLTTYAIPKALVGIGDNDEMLIDGVHG